MVRRGLRLGACAPRFAAAEIARHDDDHGHDQNGEQAAGLTAVAAPCTPSRLATNADLLGRICR